MHKKNVPQDGGVIDPMLHHIYAIDDDGKFIAVRSVGWEVTNFLSIQAAEEVRSKIMSKMEAVKQGRLSPLSVHMIARGLGPSSLAKASGINWLKVRLHLMPWFFNRMSAADTKRYAEVFSIDPLRLSEFPELLPIPKENIKEDRKAE
jgi:hypothetical protein